MRNATSIHLTFNHLNYNSPKHDLKSRDRRVLLTPTIGKREYPEDYVDYDIGYAKRNEDFAYDWAKRNGKTLRKVIGVLFTDTNDISTNT